MLSDADLLQRAQKWLQELIALDTSNPPGNERVAITWIARVLEEFGISSTIISAAPGRDSLVASVKGRSEERSSLILTSHVDVVPAQVGDGWRHPPFSGVADAGCIWGRGAIDMKFKTIFDLVALIRAAERGTATSLTMVALADEEEGGALGAQYLLRNHRALLKGDIVLNEIGGVPFWIGGVPLVLIQSGEKGVTHLTVSFKGVPSHASTPFVGNVIEALGRSLTEISSLGAHYVSTASTRAFLSTLSSSLPSPYAEMFSALNDPQQAMRVLDAIPDLQLRTLFRVMILRTITPTVVRAGDKNNVVPGSAEIGIDMRTLPGEDIESLINEISRVCNVARGGCSVDVKVHSTLAGYEIPVAHPAITQITDVVKRAWGKKLPSLKVTPYLLPASSDSVHYAAAGFTPIGFSPLLFDEHFSWFSLPHSIDERVPISAFTEGLSLYLRVIDEWEGAR